MTFELFHNLLQTEKTQLPKVIALSVGNPTREKLTAITDSYASALNRSLIVAIVGQELAGCIGLELKKNQIYEILHIAVAENFQRSGIGRALIEESIRRFSPTELIAETDDGAIDFYLNSKFEIFETFKNDWKVRRYRVLRAPSI